MNKIFFIILCFFWLQEKAMAFTMTSSAFDNNKSIPKIYTCDGKKISPPLDWSDAPSGTKSFVLICDDPDAPNGVWDHWILFNIPASTDGIEENVQKLPEGTQQGNNSWNKTGYGAPCPPSGQHRYIFTLYSLDTTLNLKNGVSKAELKAAMKDHTLGKTQLIGVYKRGST